MKIQLTVQSLICHRQTDSRLCSARDTLIPKNSNYYTLTQFGAACGWLFSCGLS